MVFTEIDTDTMKTLCTLVKITQASAHEEDIVRIGQQLGVPKDEVLLLMEEWEEHDVFRLTSREDKVRFVRHCFSYMHRNYHPEKGELKLYQKVVEVLGVPPSSN